MADIPDHIAALGRPRGLCAKIWFQPIGWEQAGTLASIGGICGGFVHPTLISHADAMVATQSALRTGLAWRTIEADTDESWAFQTEEEAAAMLRSGQEVIDFSPLQANALVTCVTPGSQERAKAYLAGVSA